VEKIINYRLKNGLRVVLLDANAYPSATSLLLVGAGSRYENKQNNGIAHFFEHMAFKGSKKYPNTMVLSSTIEGLGGVFNAFTGKDNTGYWIKAPVRHLETVIDVLSDMIKNPLLLPEEIEREKGVIIEEINMYEDTPQYRVEDLYEGLLYKDSPLGFDITGTKKTVSRFKRLTFLNYINRHYFPSNAVFIVAGGIKETIQPLKQIISQRFADWRRGRAASYLHGKEKQIKPRSRLEYKKTEQAHLVLGFRAFPFSDSRKYVSLVLATILGRGMSSRLFYQLRERRGLCYYISSSIKLYQDTGSFYTRAGVANSQERIGEAVKLILAEHKKIVVGQLEEEEIKRAKEIVKGRLILSLEDSFNLANFYGLRYLLENKIQSPLSLMEKVDKVSRQELISLAKDLFRSEKLNFSLISSYKELPLEFNI